MKKIFTLFAALACVMSMSAVTYNVTVPAGTKACYIAGEMNSWSFTEMTKVDDTHYTVTLAEATEAMGYKYCSGPGWAYVEKTEGGEEIGNRVYAVKDVVAKWASVYDPGNAPTPGEAKDITIKAKVPATWTNTITAWVWPTGGEGKEVTPTKEGEWYIYTQNCAELNIIFKNGTGWNGDINQTVDITMSESTCVEITAGTGKATYTIVDCEDNPGEEPGDDPVVDPETGVTYTVTVPAGTKACYIAGEMNGWSQQEMTKVDETHYTITIATATTAMKYKYCSGPSWDYVEKTVAGGDVANRVYSANDVVEAWAAVYDPTSTPIDPAQITYVLMGVKGDWTNGIAMIKNESAESEEYMLIGQTIAEGDSVKVVRLENGTAKHWCGNVKDGCKELVLENTVNDNIVLAPGSYDFYYDVAADAIWIAVSTHSAIDNVAVENRAVKIIRNGQMFILRDGMMYNIVGQIAE